jgi:hypothetical protein
MAGLLTRDGIALTGDEFWPRLDDVKQYQVLLHNTIEGHEFDAPASDLSTIPIKSLK